MELLHANVIGEGKPFIILHGYLGMSDNWKTLGMQFAKTGHEVHLLDLRNHGRSFHSDTFNYGVMAQDVARYIEEKNLEDVILLGHSMGGKVAMFAAASRPEKMNRIIVADISPKYYPPHHQNILKALQSVDFSLKPNREEVEKTLKKQIKEEGVVPFLMKSAYRVSSDQLAFRFNLNAFIAHEDKVGEKLPDNACFDSPALFIRGGKSDYVKDTDFELIKSHFPQAEIKTIAEAGHWLHAEKPLEFFDVVSAFLRK